MQEYLTIFVILKQKARRDCYYNMICYYIYVKVA